MKSLYRLFATYTGSGYSSGTKCFWRAEIRANAACQEQARNTGGGGQAYLRALRLYSVSMRFLRLMLSTLLLMLSAAAVAGGVPAYRIDLPGRPPSFLLGSLHVPHPGLRQPSPAVLDGARILVIEHTTADERPDFTLAPEVLEGMQKGVMRRARWAEGLVAGDLERIASRLRCNSDFVLKPDTLDMMTRLRSPRLLSQFAWVPCSGKARLSRDDLIGKEAAARGVPVLTLETQTEIEARRRSLPDTLYAAWLQAALKSDIDAGYTRLVEAFNRGDFEAIGAQSAATLTDPAMRQLFHRVMLNERNRAWLPALRHALDGGAAVVVVGAAHLPGDDGLVALLRAAGYPVVPTVLVGSGEDLN